MPADKPRRRASKTTPALSSQPQDQRRSGPKAASPARHRARPQERGPGGLGYVLALEEHEKARIDWHEDPAAHAPPPPQRKR